jgi:hypothetical protein
MATACIAQLTFRGEHFPKPIVARYDQPDASLDGGAVLLKAIDAQLGLSAELAAGLHDGRQPGKIMHSVSDLPRQRLFGLACGYADANDAARPADAPIHKLLLDRDPLVGPPSSSRSPRSCCGPGARSAWSCSRWS